MGPHTSKHQHRRGSTPAHTGQPNLPKLAAAKSDSLISVQKYDLSRFAVIAVIFNPMKYQSRYNHYRKFEAHMAQSGVTLCTVECIFESAERFGLSKQKFELIQSGDWRRIRIVAPSILWMKENLINVALKQIPERFEYIAWIDADIEFEHLDWPHRTIAELNRYPIVQLFELSYFLGPGGKNEILRRDYSFGYSIRKNKPIDPRRYDEWYAHPGYGWAMRRSALNAIGGLLDFCIIGSGDLHFAFALLRRIEETLRPGLHPDYRQLALLWGQRVADIAQNGASVGYVPVNVWHHWHGERKDRNYVDRWAILEKHNFSPINDLEKNNDTGLIRLADKTNFGYHEVQRIEALERDIVAYFQSRDEDKKQVTAPDVRPLPPPKKNTSVPPKPRPHHATGSGGGGGFKPSKISSGYSTGNQRPFIFTSGPAGSHVDDHNPYLDHCTCPDHCHHPDNHECDYQPQPTTCFPTDHHNDHHGHHHHEYDCQPQPTTCFPTDHHNDHHDHHHHHHDDDQYGGHHSSHEHEHHGGCDNNESHGGGGDYHDSGYSGPGSFY